MRIRSFAAGSGVLTLLAVASLTFAGPAQAAPQITIEPSGNVSGGTKITATFTGFSPNAPVAVGICPTDRVKSGGIKGQGDCGRSKDGAAKLTVADASGKGTAELTVVEGKLGNATAPAANCPPCAVAAQNIAVATENAFIELEYGDAAPPPKVDEPDQGAVDESADQGADQGTEPDGLVQTGPRETAVTAVIALAMLQVGLVLAVRSHRSRPRRTTA